MPEVRIVIREIGRMKPDYSLRFSLPEIPRVGEYISVYRPDSETHTEDVVVRKVWWLLQHGETRGVVDAGDELVGRVREIMVECEQAIGPYARDRWVSSLEAAEARGVEVERFDIARFTVREADLKG